jgi:hypothetical protein
MICGVNRLNHLIYKETSVAGGESDFGNYVSNVPISRYSMVMTLDAFFVEPPLVCHIIAPC